MKNVCVHVSLAALLLMGCAAHLVSAAAPTPVAGVPETTDRNIALRDSTRNCGLIFKETGKGHVAFIGGSITEMNGYRPILASALQRQFPQTTFTFTAAGIASTCSTTGAHRLQEDVLSKGKVDLFFIEFAVNDDQDAGHARREALRGLEGILRQCRTNNPKMDIIVTFFVNEGMIDLISKGKPVTSIQAHEAVCAHYNVANVNLAKEVTQLISEQKLTWKQFGGVHPGLIGNTLAARMCWQILEASWDKPAKETADYAMPKEPLDAGNYGNGHFVDPKAVERGEGWALEVPDWKKIPGSFRDHFAGRTLLTSATPGAQASLAFEGQAIGVYVLAGPDAGTLEVRIDEGEWKKVNLFHNYSRGLHYPRTVMLATDLKQGKHVATIRISDEHHPASKGTAARILKFAVN